MIAALLMLAQLQLGEPVARIGAIDDDRQALNVVTRVVEDPRTGRVFVLQRGDADVAAFDSSGHYVATLGRRGGGPGEFAVPVYVGLHHESVWVSDMSLRKLSRFDRSTLEHERDVVLPGGEYRRTPFTTGAEGRIVFMESRPERVLLRNGERTLWSHPARTGVSMIDLGGRATTLLQPFIDRTMLLAPVEGDGIVVLQPDGERLRLLRLTTAGDTVLDAPLPIEPTPVTDRIYERWIEQFMEVLRPVPVSVMSKERALREAIERPGAAYGIHGVGNIATGPGDILWIGSELHERWDAVDARTGDHLGSLMLPEEVVIKTGSRTHVWLLEKDELDVNYLVKYPLTGLSPG